MARHVASAPFATTRKRLLSAVVTTAIFLVGVALVAGVFRGFNTSLDMLLGAAVVLLPSAWVATSLTSGRSLISPIWLGLARYSRRRQDLPCCLCCGPTVNPRAY